MRISSSSPSVIIAVFAMALLTIVSGQEGPSPGPGGGRGGRRGGAALREFLGLGTAPDPAAAKKGEAVYKENCGTCHGATARGGQAPSLVRSIVVLHDEKDEEIGPVIKNGRPQAGMPAFPNLSQDDIHNVAQFIKLQIELAANRGTYGQTYGQQRNQISGDAAKGAAFFSAKCTSCHSATGDLAKIGAKYPDPAILVPRFLWPSSPAPKKATVTTASGQTISGSIKEIDDFGISLVDASGEYHYWPMKQVKVQLEDKLGGHRSLLPQYSDADIHNMTAYLVTLK